MLTTITWLLKSNQSFGIFLPFYKAVQELLSGIVKPTWLLNGWLFLWRITRKRSLGLFLKARLYILEIFCWLTFLAVFTPRLCFKWSDLSKKKSKPTYKICRLEKGLILRWRWTLVAQAFALLGPLEESSKEVVSLWSFFFF